MEDPNAPAPGPSFGQSSGPSSSPGSVQIASLKTDVVIHRQQVAQAEANAARAKDILSAAEVQKSEVMEVELLERIREAEVAVAFARDLLVQAEEDLRCARDA